MEVTIKEVNNSLTATAGGNTYTLLAASETDFYLTSSFFNMHFLKDEKGNEIELTEGNYSNFIKSKDRRVRKDAFETLFRTYKGFRMALLYWLTRLNNIT